jgi:hypothetical protein
VGARDKRDVAVIDGFLSLYSVVPLSDNIGTRAYGLLKTYAKSHGLHVFDSLIAASRSATTLELEALDRGICGRGIELRYLRIRERTASSGPERKQAAERVSEYQECPRNRMLSRSGA